MPMDGVEFCFFWQMKFWPRILLDKIEFGWIWHLFFFKDASLLWCWLQVSCWRFYERKTIAKWCLWSCKCRCGRLHLEVEKDFVHMLTKSYQIFFWWMVTCDVGQFLAVFGSFSSSCFLSNKFEELTWQDSSLLCVCVDMAAYWWDSLITSHCILARLGHECLGPKVFSFALASNLVFFCRHRDRFLGCVGKWSFALRGCYITSQVTSFPRIEERGGAKRRWNGVVQGEKVNQEQPLLKFWVAGSNHLLCCSFCCFTALFPNAMLSWITR